MPRYNEIRRDPRFRQIMESLEQTKKDINKLSEQYRRFEPSLRRFILLQSGMLPIDNQAFHQDIIESGDSSQGDRFPIYITYGNNLFIYDSDTRTITQQNVGIRQLSLREDTLMYMFATHAAKPLSRQQIIQNCGWPETTSNAHVTVDVKNLREKADIRNSKYVHHSPKSWTHFITVPEGYMFVPEGVI